MLIPAQNNAIIRHLRAATWLLARPHHNTSTIGFDQLLSLIHLVDFTFFIYLLVGNIGNKRDVLLMNASRLLSGDHDGVLMVPCPPSTGITLM